MRNESSQIDIKVLTDPQQEISALKAEIKSGLPTEEWLPDIIRTSKVIARVYTNTLAASFIDPQDNAALLKLAVFPASGFLTKLPERVILKVAVLPEETQWRFNEREASFVYEPRSLFNQRVTGKSNFRCAWGSIRKEENAVTAMVEEAKRNLSGLNGGDMQVGLALQIARQKITELKPEQTLAENLRSNLFFDRRLIYSHFEVDQVPSILLEVIQQTGELLAQHQI